MTRITDNVYWQMPGESLAEALSDNPITGSISSSTLRHVINLYAPSADSLDEIQTRTVATMESARACSTQIELVAITAPGDRNVVPQFFDGTVEIARSLRDISGWETERPLPLVFDLLSAGAQGASSGDFLVFTNSDICLQPFFYSFIHEALAAGYDALIINRRTVQGHDPAISSVIAAADLGQNHPGLDCFVFPVAWVDDFVRNNACVGIGLVMRGLLMNLVARAEALLVLTEAHLTYHYGDDRPWAASSMKPLQEHNKREAESAYAELAKAPDKKQRLSDFFEILPKYRTPGVRA